MNLVNGNKSNTLYIETGPDDYYYSLQRYSTLYRILLARPYFTEIKFNTWNRIDLKLVNELGLTLTGDEKKHCRMEIDCQLLAEKEGTVQLSKECSITCRPIQHDAWEFTNASDIAGFHHDTYGNFEYMITIQDEGLALSPQITPTKYYIQIHPVYHPQQTIKALPLIIGPFTITETTPSMTTFLTENIDKEWKEPKTSLNIFHGYCLQDNSFLIVKEDWNMGTPGKMWDSALVLSQLFCDKINADPNYLNGCRLLDLSAGTGCVGLLIASMYKIKQKEKKKIKIPKITMTDLEEALEIIYENRAYNHLERYTEIKVLKWGEYNDVQKVLKDGAINTIIASDILYDPASFPKLVQTLDWLSSEQTDIYLGYKRRGLDPQIEQSFFNICSEKFYIKLLEKSSSRSQRGWILSEFSDICQDTGVNIYQLTRK